MKYWKYVNAANAAKHKTKQEKHKETHGNI